VTDPALGTGGDAAQSFQVDLRGVVDLLSRHLYSGPRVYVRELLQNATDAVTARRALDVDAPARVRFRGTDGGGLEVTDTGVGLTPDEARELLATVGRSSKRDLELGGGRTEFLGQFGIGLLSAFTVSDRIELESYSAAHPDAPGVRWVGHSDGTYDLTVLDRTPDAPVGSTVRLRPRRDMDHWLAPETVAALATEFGSLLPLDVAVEVPLDAAGDVAWRRVTEPDLPWRATYPDDAARERALVHYCERTLGFTPLACIDLDVPLTGASGVAFVLPAAVPPGGGRHRVYLKRMLVGERVDGLLPDWAFYVRCVVDADGLVPTASREALYDDEALLVTRDALAGQVRDWTVRTLRTTSRVARELVATHHLAVRSLALVDDEMLDLAAQVLPFETSDGPRTLAEVAVEGAVVHTTSIEEYRRVAPIARAQGLLVVNAGYVYDADLLGRLGARAGWDVRPLRARDVAQVLDHVAPGRELALLDTLRAATAAVRDLDVEVVVRRFAPEDLPAVLLDDRDDEHRRGVAAAVDAADDLWGGVLAGFATEPAPARRLVLNDASTTVRRLLAGAHRPDVFAAGLRSLYVTAVLLAGEPLRGRDATTMTDAMTVLLEAGLGTAGPDAARDPEGSATTDDQEDAP